MEHDNKCMLARGWQLVRQPTNNCLLTGPSNTCQPPAAHLRRCWLPSPAGASCGSTGDSLACGGGAAASGAGWAAGGGAGATAAAAGVVAGSCGMTRGAVEARSALRLCSLLAALASESSGAGAEQSRVCRKASGMARVAA